MNTEYEAKFYPIDKTAFRALLKSKDAVLVRDEVKTTIVIFSRRINPQITGNYIRVRDEGDVIRLSVKVHATEGGDISDQKETDTIVQDFDSTVSILKCAGLKQSGYQEKMRETWELDGAEVVIDTWPGLEPYIEIEADSAEKVEQIAKLLGCNWNEKIITSVVEIYKKKYGWSADEAWSVMENLTFDHHPFTDK